MSERKDGGPAFPVLDLSKTQCEGVSVRDYFAAHATEEDVQYWRGNDPAISRERAKMMYADSMLTERDR